MATMFKFLYIFCSSLVGFIGTGPDADGWVSLENVVERTEQKFREDEKDSLVWVVFSKQVGEENIMVRFPEDPAYREIPEGLEILSKVQGASYTLYVLDPVSIEDVGLRVERIASEKEVSFFEVIRVDLNTWDLSYQKDGRWMGQRFHLTSQHLYVLETEQDCFSAQNHDRFVSSLDVL